MTEPVRTGVIGCGTIALIGVLPHLSLPDARERIEVRAVCDVVGERARATAERFGVGSAYEDPHELIARDDIDLVLILTPIPYHYEYAIAALEAGKHVYVQKTMARTFAEAQKMVAAAEARDRVLVAAPGQMLAPGLQRIASLIADGALGKVYWAWGSTGGWGHEFEDTRHGSDTMTAIDPSWYYREGGPVQDTTVYVLHSLTGILGPVRQVTAMSGTAMAERTWQGTTMPVTVDDNTLLLLDFGEVTFGVAGGNSAEVGRLVDWGSFGIYGSAGVVETLEVEPLSGLPEQLYVKAAVALDELDGGTEGTFVPGALSGIDPSHHGLPEPHVYADILHCVDCITSGAAPVASGAHAAHVVEVIEKGYQAAREGRTLTLDSSF